MDKKLERKKNLLMNRIEEEKAEQAEQQRLHSKYDIADENVKIVEKPALVKFLIKTVIRFVQTILTIVIILLAATGVITLCYESLRTEFISILYDAFQILG